MAGRGGEGIEEGGPMIKKAKMKVECGSLHWRGEAVDFNDAVIAAFAPGLPDSLAVLCRVWNGQRWLYIESRAALKIAGYAVRDLRREVP